MNGYVRTRRTTVAPRATPIVARALALALALVLTLALLGCTGGGTEGAGTTATAGSTVGPTTSTAADPTPSTTDSAPDDLTGAELTALLSPEDVQGVAGLAEVRRAGRNPDRRLGGDLNFVLPDGRPLLMVVVEPAASFEAWKADPDSYREELADVGEAAFIGPAAAMNEEPYLVVFRSGERTIGLLTYDDPDAEGWNNLLTMEQLRALAQVVIGRL